MQQLRTLGTALTGVVPGVNMGKCRGRGVILKPARLKATEQG